MIVAVVGCLHGKLEFLYEELRAWELKTGQKVDFIVCSGDFQSLRDGVDMIAMECPDKYKEIGQFQRFFKREIIAPILTLFVGGNHEASNYLRDLYYGGWVAENIYYLGSSGVVTVTKGDERIRVGGISGIEKHYDYLKGYCERWPYIDDKDGLRSIYHTRQFDV
jgi:lariat debranching enzyme